MNLTEDSQQKVISLVVDGVGVSIESKKAKTSKKRNSPEWKKIRKVFLENISKAQLEYRIAEAYWSKDMKTKEISKLFFGNETKNEYIKSVLFRASKLHYATSRDYR